jgi:hypothetical protein
MKENGNFKNRFSTADLCYVLNEKLKMDSAT